ncbi:hypothetical protein DL98DRAFT_588702 [Cadophora sp. DSE1049]|nr:hypothetical protein DL98DRAFT_588702 [Cadophora sp. DSE1049]
MPSLHSSSIGIPKEINELDSDHLHSEGCIESDLASEVNKDAAERGLLRLIIRQNAGTTFYAGQSLTDGSRFQNGSSCSLPGRRYIQSRSKQGCKVEVHPHVRSLVRLLSERPGSAHPGDSTDTRFRCESEENNASRDLSRVQSNTPSAAIERLWEYVAEIEGESEEEEHVGCTQVSYFGDSTDDPGFLVDKVDPNSHLDLHILTVVPQGAFRPARVRGVES